jgi:hypothetical protein
VEGYRLQQHKISITKTDYNPNNNTLYYQLVPPKTRKSKRKIIVYEEVIHALKKHLEIQNQVIKRLGKDYYKKTLSLRRWKGNTVIP